MNNYKVKESKEFNNYGDEDHFPLQNESPEILEWKDIASELTQIAYKHILGNEINSGQEKERTNQRNLLNQTTNKHKITRDNRNKIELSSSPIVDKRKSPRTEKEKVSTKKQEYISRQLLTPRLERSNKDQEYGKARAKTPTSRNRIENSNNIYPSPALELNKSYDNKRLTNAFLDSIQKNVNEFVLNLQNTSDSSPEIKHNSSTNIIKSPYSKGNKRLNTHNIKDKLNKSALIMNHADNNKVKSKLKSPEGGKEPAFDGFLNRLYSFQNLRNEKIAAKKRNIQEHELACLQNKPEISAKSKNIVKNRHTKIYETNRINQIIKHKEKSIQMLKSKVEMEENMKLQSEIPKEKQQGKKVSSPEAFQRLCNPHKQAIKSTVDIELSRHCSFRPTTSKLAQHIYKNKGELSELAVVERLISYGLKSKREQKNLLKKYTPVFQPNLVVSSPNKNGIEESKKNKHNLKNTTNSSIGMNSLLQRESNTKMDIRSSMEVSLKNELNMRSKWSNFQEKARKFPKFHNRDILENKEIKEESEANNLPFDMFDIKSLLQAKKEMNYVENQSPIRCEKYKY